eukprot:Opistho-1_new@20612
MEAAAPPSGSSSPHIEPKVVPAEPVPTPALSAGTTYTFPATEEHRTGTAEYIKSVVYGGLDGLVSIFVSVVSVVGTNASIHVILAIGVAKLFAGGFSMGVGDWLSTRADIDFIKSERKRELWELTNYPEGERKEMVEFYVARGLRRETAERIVEIMSQNSEAFVNVMMVEELELNPADEFQSAPKNGLVNFTAFMLFGIVPLFVYIVLYAMGSDAETIAIGVSSGCTALFLLLLGAVKGYFTGTPLINSALVTFACGAVSAAIGFGVSYGLRDYGTVV